MFTKKTVKDIDVKSKIVLVRTDYNVPMKDGKITSDLRIKASLPTLEYLKKEGARRIIIISHLGRPEGQKNPERTLKPAADKLAELMPDAKVNFVDDVSGPDVEEAIEKAPEGGIIVLENLRFYPGEEKNSEDFAREIFESTHADVFVQDGFAVVHRAHASTDAITNCLPSVAGFLLEKEISALSEVLNNPERPLMLMLGGAKVDDKAPLIEVFKDKADAICVGGKIAADGAVEKDSDKIYIAEDFDEDSTGAKLDCGPLSTHRFAETAKNSKTVLWNGLLGKAEDPAYATSSTIFAKTLGENPNITSIICGGDTTGFCENLITEYNDLKFTLLSTGGGAALEYLSGNSLPGLDALENKD